MSSGCSHIHPSTKQWRTSNHVEAIFEEEDFFYIFTNHDLGVLMCRNKATTSIKPELAPFQEKNSVVTINLQL